MPAIAKPFDASFVFLDRDGVINRKRPEGEYVTTPDQLEMLPGAAEAIARLNKCGRKVIVITNQRGVALGRMTEVQVDAIHDHLRLLLGMQGATLDAIYVCPHNRNQCNCRKPATGMIEAAFRDFPGANASNSILIGDTLSDIQCGLNAGIPTILVEGEPEHRKPGLAEAQALANATVADLAAAVELLGI